MKDGYERERKEAAEAGDGYAARSELLTACMSHGVTVPAVRCLMTRLHRTRLHKTRLQKADCSSLPLSSLPASPLLLRRTPVDRYYSQSSVSPSQTYTLTLCNHGPLFST
jgi:hypothetical protein